MGFWIFMFCMVLLIPLTMVGFGWVFLHRPPKEINGFYGYRTRRSTASPQAWAFAHAYMGRLWLWTGIGMLLPVSAVMLCCIGKSVDETGIWGTVVLTAECVLMLLPIIPTERALKKRF